jgi:hypothetical protein
MRKLGTTVKGGLLALAGLAIVVAVAPLAHSQAEAAKIEPECGPTRQWTCTACPDCYEVPFEGTVCEKEVFEKKTGLVCSPAEPDLGNPRHVHFIYLVPQDRREVGTAAIQQAALHLQRWYQQQMGNGKTFTTDNTVVTVIHTAHPASYYETGTFGKAIADAGAGFCREFDDYVIYLDAEPGPGEGLGGLGCGAIGGNPDYGGIAVLWSKDIHALMGIDPDWTLCRGIGGSGHEFGHSLNLPHPPGPPNPYWTSGIMGVGYTIYANCVLTPDDKATLNVMPFMAYMPPLTLPKDPCPLNQ